MIKAIFLIITIAFTNAWSIDLTSNLSNDSKKLPLISSQCDNNATNKLDGSLVSFVQPARGCCSWHDGVCGCSNGRAKCCDGTLSPTCGCD